MKTSDLIKALTDHLAANGDLDVYLRSNELGSYSQLHASQLRLLPIHRERGKQSSFVDGDKARQLGYDLDDHAHGITLG